LGDVITVSAMPAVAVVPAVTFVAGVAGVAVGCLMLGVVDLGHVATIYP
jgi:hypothetical protein